MTVAAVGVTAYSGAPRRKVEEQSDAGRGRGHRTCAGSLDDLCVRSAQLQITQWAIPVLTATLIVLGPHHGEQQHASQQLRGRLPRF